MTTKELDNYMKTVNPNFDSHIEKGTIEMSNEYYNLLEEKMARLINENQELKEKIEEYKNGYFKLSEENDKYSIKLHKYKVQQKEFIKYLKDEINKCQSNIFADGVKYGFQLSLQKYKSIIGE